MAPWLTMGRGDEVEAERTNALGTLRVLRRSAIIATLIVVAVVGLVAWDYILDRAEARAESNAALLESYVLRVVQNQDVMLTAADRALGRFASDDGYGRAAHVFLRELSERSPSSIGLAFVLNDGRFLVSSAVYPTDDASIGERDYLKETPDTGLYVDRIRIAPDDVDALVITRRSTLVPRADGVWASAITLTALKEVLGRIAERTGDTASLIREDGLLIVRNAEPDGPVRLDAAQPAVLAMASGRARLTYRAEAMTDGVERIYAIARVGDLPLFVVAGVSLGAVWRDWAVTMAVAVAVFGTMGASAYLMTLYAERSLRAEAAQAALAFDRRLLEEAEKTAAVKETMLRELTHRVKNSLQMINALIRLQRGRPEGPDLDEIGARVAAIATIHDLLYQSSGDFEVDFAELLRRIAESPAVVPPEAGVEVTVEAESIELDAGLATPLALCAVELVTNAAKHAYGGASGRILLRLERLPGERARLVVADDGRGLAAGSARRSGLRVVDALVLQVGGRLEAGTGEGGRGLRYEITLPISRPEDRIAADVAAS